MPKELITSTQLEELRLQRRPSFIPVSPDVDPTKVYDKETGITQRRLSNGIPVNYKVYIHIFLLHAFSCLQTKTAVKFSFQLSLVISKFG